MNNKVKLTILGFSFNKVQSSTYGLVLAEDGGLRRLMIVVGAPEAQSIAFRLQNIDPPRPLTHDLFKPILDSYYIELQEVIISDFIDGVFHSKLVLKQENHIVEIDSRTSDAVAIAIRTNTPIYTTEKIMQELGVVINDEDFSEDETAPESLHNKPYDFSLLELEELQYMLKGAIKDEDYELASILRDEILKKKEE